MPKKTVFILLGIVLLVVWGVTLWLYIYKRNLAQNAALTPTSQLPSGPVNIHSIADNTGVTAVRDDTTMKTVTLSGTARTVSCHYPLLQAGDVYDQRIKHVFLFKKQYQRIFTGRQLLRSL